MSGKMSVTSTCKIIPISSCLIVIPLVHLLLISLKLKQLKLIDNPLCYLKDQLRMENNYVFFYRPHI